MTYFRFRCETCDARVVKQRTPFSVAAHGVPRFCDLACAGAARRGPANPMWNGGGTHGTAYTYQTLGCRCDVCVLAFRARKGRLCKANRLDRLRSGRLSHGTRSAYDAGCRCGPCREVRRAAYRREAEAA